MRKLQLILAAAAAALALPSPAQAQAQDNGPPGLRTFFSGTAADGTPFSGTLFYLGSSVPGSFITFTINGQQFSYPITIGEAGGPVLSPPTPTNGQATFVAGNYPTDFALFSVTNISGQIGSTYVGVSPAVADILNRGDAGAGIYSGGSFSFGGPVTYHFDYLPAFPEPTTWAMMLLGFGAVGFILRRQRTSARLPTS